MIIARSFRPIVEQRLLVELVAPLVSIAESPLPQLVGRGIGRNLVLVARLHIHSVYLIAVGRVGEADIEHFGVLLGLGNAVAHILLVALRLHHGQLHALVHQDIVGLQGLGCNTFAHPAVGYRIFHDDVALLCHIPPRFLQCGVYLVQSGLGFVHNR